MGSRPTIAPAPGDVVAGRFRLTRHLGSGGMGSVFAAHDQWLAGRVALKFLPHAVASELETAAEGTARRRFYREVALTRAVRSPYVCQVYDVGQHGGWTFLSMEFVDGESLADLFSRGGPLDLAQANRIAAQLCAGLRSAHEAGVLHRDLKPDNVLVNRSGEVRITDFGLARSVGDSSDGDENAGTPATMAPEQLVGGGTSVRSDLFSLGLVLYQLYTGRPAVVAETIEDLVREHEQFPPHDPSFLCAGLDAGVARIVRACLEVDPDRRPASASAVQQVVTRAERVKTHRGRTGRNKLVATLPALMLGALAGTRSGDEAPVEPTDTLAGAHPVALAPPEPKGCDGSVLMQRALHWAHDHLGRRIPHRG